MNLEEMKQPTQSRSLEQSMTMAKISLHCILNKSCSENMQQTYERTTHAQSDFNKVAKKLY